MTTEKLIRLVEGYRHIDALAVDDALQFIRDTEAGKNPLSTHDPRTSRSIDCFEGPERQELARRWNGTAPIHRADSRS